MCPQVFLVGTVVDCGQFQGVIQICCQLFCITIQILTRGNIGLTDAIVSCWEIVLCRNQENGSQSQAEVRPFLGDSDVDDKFFSTSVTKNVKTLVKVRGNRWMSWMQHVNNISSVRNVPECSLERYIWNSHCKSY